MKREIAVDFTIDSARARPASAFSVVRARNTVGMPAAANTAPLPDPIAPFAPRTTTFRIGLPILHRLRDLGSRVNRILLAIRAQILVKTREFRNNAASHDRCRFTS